PSPRTKRRRDLPSKAPRAPRSVTRSAVCLASDACARESAAKSRSCLGGSVTPYSTWIQKLLDDERAQQASLEQRGLAVISTSATLGSLLFGLVAVLTEATDFILPGSAKTGLAIALAAFALAALFGLLTNLPLYYTVP